MKQNSKTPGMSMGAVDNAVSLRRRDAHGLDPVIPTPRTATVIDSIVQRGLRFIGTGPRQWPTHDNREPKRSTSTFLKHLLIAALACIAVMAACGFTAQLLGGKP